MALMAGTGHAGTIDINEGSCANWYLSCNASINADTASYADVAGVARSVSNTGTATITGNSDNSAGGTEGVFIQSQGNASYSNGAFINVIGNNNTINAVGSNTINAATNNITATTNNITGTTNNINGETFINTNNNAGTSINTGTSKGSVTIGNQNDGGITLNSKLNFIGNNSSYSSDNEIGSSNAGTTVTNTAGNAQLSLYNNNALTSVSAGVSQLTARTGTANVATNSQVWLSNGGGANVDANGKLSASGAAAAAPTVGVTLQNGYGNVNGMVVTERQTSISGGTAASTASTLTMNDNGARFSNASTGAPVTVTGVADGKNDFDAINVRQFANAIASVAAQANIPALAAGQEKTIGVGVANFMGKTGVALGMNIRGEESRTYKLSVSSGLSGGAKPVIAGGAAWSF